MGEFVKRFAGIEKQALRKLDMLHAARQLNDLRATSKSARSPVRQPSGPALDPNQQSVARICFTWTQEGPANVEIVD